MNKYKVAPAEQRKFQGRTYASKSERMYAEHLYNLKQSGVIRVIVEQPRVEIVAGYTYRADFLCIWTDGTVEFVDVKGMETTEFKRTAKLWKEQVPMPLRVIKYKHRKFATDRVINGE